MTLTVAKLCSLLSQVVQFTLATCERQITRIPVAGTVSVKTFYPLARALHWHAIWQAFVCPSSNPVRMLVRWRARSSGPHGWMGGRARAQRACRSVWRVGGERKTREEEEKRGGREEEEERRRKRREERFRGEVSPEKPAAGEL